jgi:NAD(P)-dependent dehydrogenase (short-subunit alcohol dehydrogenase family)
MQIDKTIVAFITGGASGLGLASARQLKAAGATLCLLDRDAEKGRAAAAELGAEFQLVDISDAGSVATALTAARQVCGVERILINCAGVGGAAKTVSRGQPHDPDLFARTVSINLIGSFQMAAASAAAMAELDPITESGGRGVIIHTASVAAYEGQIGQVAYAASKGGIAAMTLPMARDLADKGIRVMTIAPGLFRTPLLDSLPEEVQESLGAQVPHPSRLGKPEEFARLVEHIIINDMLNGEVIRLDGAIRMAPR